MNKINHVWVSDSFLKQICKRCKLIHKSVQNGFITSPPIDGCLSDNEIVIKNLVE